jgi:D-3-phosphoglycerate dehydrogenase
MQKVIFIDPAEPPLWQALADMGFQCDDRLKASRAEVLAALGEYEGMVIRSRLKVDRELLDHAPNLRFVARSGVGVEHIDLEYAAQRGVAVLTSPEGSRDTVGEHTVGLLLMLMNNLARADRQVREGQWIRAGNRGYELGGKTVGIIGYGNMGTAFARRLAGFGCTVLAYDKYRQNYGDAFAEAVDLATLQAQADVVSLHIPYEPENRYFANGAFWDAFAKPVWVVNTARGLVLHTADLADRLASGRVLGAALDVIEYEEQSFAHLNPAELPPPFQYLLQSANVVLTPHIAGWSYEAEEGHARVLAQKIGALYGQKV